MVLPLHTVADEHSVILLLEVCTDTCQKDSYPVEALFPRAISTTIATFTSISKIPVSPSAAVALEYAKAQWKLTLG